MQARFLSTTILTATVLGAAAPALAQTGNAPPVQTAPSPQPDNAATATSPAGTSGDIIVTARKRDERLIDVPISIQAFARAEIKASGIDNLQSLKERAGFQMPQVLSTAPTGRFQGTIIFRGLNAASFGAPRDNSGSLFVDGIFISGGQQSVNTADVERIEVLKGPQNAYFGRSTFGGAVNFITRNPSEHLAGELNVRATVRGNIDGDASIEGPIVAGLLRGRITGYIHDQVPQFYAHDGGELGQENSKGVTATLYATPAHNMWLRLRGTYQHDDDSTGTTALISANQYAAGACTGRVFPGFNGRTGVRGITLARNYFCNGLPQISQIGTSFITASTVVSPQFATALRTNPSNFPFFSSVPALDHAGLRRDAYRAALQGGYTFDSGASFAFNAGYNKQDSEAIYDIDRTDALGFLNARAYKTQDLTLDARFLTDPTKRIRLLLGSSYFFQKAQDLQLAYNYRTTAVTRDPVFTDERANVPAVYGSVDFDILPSLTLTGEARYQWDKTTSFDPANNKYVKTFKSFLPRAVIRFKPTPDMSVYASYSKGVQPAGFSGAFVNATAPQRAYIRTIFPGADIFSLLPKLTDYEVGLKAKMLDGRVNFSVAAYQLDWKNATTVSAIFNPDSCYPPAPAAAITLTAACPLSLSGSGIQFPNDARIRGVEFEASARLTPEWNVDVTADYKHPKWTRYTNTSFNAFVGFVPGDTYRADGNYIGRVPLFTGTVSSTYRTRLNNNWFGYLRGDLFYNGRAWDSDLNIFKTKAYTRVNARVGVTRENVTFELFSTNLFKNRTYDYSAITVELSGNFTQRANLVLPAPQREFGLRTQFKF